MGFIHDQMQSIFLAVIYGEYYTVELTKLYLGGQNLATIHPSYLQEYLMADLPSLSLGHQDLIEDEKATRNLIDRLQMLNISQNWNFEES